MTQSTPTRLRTLALMLTVSEEQLGFVLTDLEARGIHTVNYRIIEHGPPPKLLQHKAAKKVKKVKKVKKGKKKVRTLLEPIIVQHFKEVGAQAVAVKDLCKIANKQGKSNAAVSYVLRSLLAQRVIFQEARGQYKIAEGASL